MRRRDLLAMLGGAAVAWPFAAHGQQSGPVKRVGVLADHDNAAQVKTLVDTLAKLGWIEGRNVAFDYEWAARGATDLRQLADELVGRRPDVIFAPGLYAWAARGATHSIPIVFEGITGPVERGLVSSLARPGGNVTGFATFDAALGGKWVGLLKEAVPTLARIATIYDPDVAPHAPLYLRAIDAAARSLGMTAAAAPVKTDEDVEAAVAALRGVSRGALAVVPDRFTGAHGRVIIAAALRHRVPAIYPLHSDAEDGGLLTYGVADADEEDRGAAQYVDRILRGADPADLPVQQPTTYRLTINLKTAKAMNLVLPPTFLARADDVIE